MATSNVSEDSAGTGMAKASTCKCLTVRRNLVVCIDGTSNQFGPHNTNVVELYNQIVKGQTVKGEQLTYYDSGIGTVARSSWRSPGTTMKQWIDTKLDLILALNIEKIILRAYQWLSNHFQEDDATADQIYLFGFSRGAYQVRALAGMIETVGLLLPGNDAQIPFAYELYANLRGIKPDAWKINFKSTFSRKHARVHFLGAWDTVAAVGFHHKTLPPSDERRAAFLHLPINVVSPTSTESLIPTTPSPYEVHIKEVWFAGTHSEVGGGSRLNVDLNSGNISLTWMRQEAQLAGLRISTPDLRLRGVDLEGVPEKSLKGKWRFLQLLLVGRPQRQIQSGQKIHFSVCFKEAPYKPTVTLPEPQSSLLTELQPLKWADMRSSASSVVKLSDNDWEKGIFDPQTATIMLEYLRSEKQPEFVHYIAFLAQSAEGKQSISNVPDAQKTLNALLADLDLGVQISAVAALLKLGFLEEAPASEHLARFGRLLKSEDTQLDARCRFLSYLGLFCENPKMQIIIHTNILPTVQDIFNNTETANILKEWCVKAFAVTASFPPSAVQNGPNRDSPGQLSGREAQGVRNTVQQPPAGQQHELRSETISTLRKIAAPELGSATYGTKQFRGPKSLGSAAAFERDHSTTVDPTSVTTKAAARRVVELVDANAARVIPETGPSQTPMMDNGCQTHAGGDDMEDLGGTKSTRENSGLAEAEKNLLL